MLRTRNAGFFEATSNILIKYCPVNPTAAIFKPPIASIATISDDHPAETGKPISFRKITVIKRSTLKKAEVYPAIENDLSIISELPMIRLEN